MFIDEKILIRLMKKAQKGAGVYIGRWDGWYVIGGSYWKARIAVGCLPRTVAAAMVELSGSIPQEGEAWTADKEKNQMEAFDIWETTDRTQSRLYVRPIWLAKPGGTPQRICASWPNDVKPYLVALLRHPGSVPATIELGSFSFGE